MSIEYKDIKGRELYADGKFIGSYDNDKERNELIDEYEEHLAKTAKKLEEAAHMILSIDNPKASQTAAKCLIEAANIYGSINDREIFNEGIITNVLEIPIFSFFTLMLALSKLRVKIMDTRMRTVQDYKKNLSFIQSVISEAKSIKYKKRIPEAIEKICDLITKYRNDTIKLDKELFSISNEQQFIAKKDDITMTYKYLWENMNRDISNACKGIKNEWVEDDASIKKLLNKLLDLYNDDNFVRLNFDDRDLYNCYIEEQVKMNKKDYNHKDHDKMIKNIIYIYSIVQKDPTDLDVLNDVYKDIKIQSSGKKIKE